MILLRFHFLIVLIAEEKYNLIKISVDQFDPIQQEVEFL